MEYYSHENIDFKILSGIQSMCIPAFRFLQHTTAILLKKKLLHILVETSLLFAGIAFKVLLW
jgi:hypothetical protein